MITFPVLRTNRCLAPSFRVALYILLDHDLPEKSAQYEALPEDVGLGIHRFVSPDPGQGLLFVPSLFWSGNLTILLPCPIPPTVTSRVTAGGIGAGIGSRQNNPGHPCTFPTPRCTLTRAVRNRTTSLSLHSHFSRAPYGRVGRPCRTDRPCHHLF
jgi:hypothetical protein